jgi:hypothetical protein
MSRTTFSGPVRAGNIRQGRFNNASPLENCLVVPLAFNSVFTTNSIVTPQTFPQTSVTIPADTGTQAYRGAVAYLPTNSTITDIFVNITTVFNTSGTTPVVVLNVGNTLNGQQYATSLALTAAGRVANVPTAAQLTNELASSIDVYDTVPASQLVFTVSQSAASGLTVATAGAAYVVVRYVQFDDRVGSTTAYPYGNPS